MAAYVHAQTDRPVVVTGISRAWFERISECFWFSLCLALFMALGPFSAPIVLGYIFFSKLSDQALTEPDPVPKQ